jgi:hypothetical protein
MLRDTLFEALERHNDDFRHRGKEIARIEAFSDAVFGFSISLLIVALEVPQTFSELRHIIYGFLPFLCTAALVFLFWYQQYRYFRHYGLNDTTTIWLNAALLVVILFYIYPLKFLFSLLLMFATGVDLFPKAAEQGLLVLRPEDLPQLIVLYSAGYALVWGIFYVLYRRAWHLRSLLDLNAYETLDTQKQLRGAGLNAGIGAVALLLASLKAPLLSGYCFFLIPVVLLLNEWAFRKALKKSQHKRPRRSLVPHA